MSQNQPPPSSFATIAELVRSWGHSASDPALSEHTILALESGAGWYATRGDPVDGIITLAPASQRGAGLVEMAALSEVSNADLWDELSTEVIGEAQRRGYNSLEVIDPSWRLGESDGRRIRAVTRMKTTSPALHHREEGATFETMDAEVIVDIINSALKDHPENGNWTLGDLEKRMQLDWFDPQGVFVEHRENRAVGFCWTKVHLDGVGEIYLIAVEPGLQGRGIGRRLLNAGLCHLVDDRYCEEIIVYCESDNHSAIKLYSECGFEIDRVDHRVEISV